MGFDMWLPSVCDLSNDAALKAIIAAAEAKAGGVPTLYSEMFRKAASATRGYYGEAYNHWGLFGVLRWHWPAYLEDKMTTLPVERARVLLGRLEGRPLTCREIENHLNGFIEAVRDAMGQQFAPPPERQVQQASSRIYSELVQSRTDLMTLLRLAIEKNEALRVSA